MKWCWLGIHNWTKWIDMDVGFTPYGVSEKGEPLGVNWLRQSRRCKNCGKIQIRRETM